MGRGLHFLWDPRCSRTAHSTLDLLLDALPGTRRIAVIRNRSFCENAAIFEAIWRAALRGVGVALLAATTTAPPLAIRPAGQAPEARLTPGTVNSTAPFTYERQSFLG
jgi:hypothetical protein